VSLTLAPGEYVYEVGLSMVPFALWANRDRVSHEEMSAAEHRICHLPEAGVFSMAIAQKNHVAQLTHHGITNLPGDLRVARIDNNPNASMAFTDLSAVSLHSENS
jgi:lipopolysaccharide transport system ATP-binding protein